MSKLNELDLNSRELKMLERLEVKPSADALTVKKDLQKITRSSSESDRQKNIAQCILDKISGKKTGKAKASTKTAKSKKVKTDKKVSKKKAKKEAPAKKTSKKKVKAKEASEEGATGKKKKIKIRRK